MTYRVQSRIDRLGDRMYEFNPVDVLYNTGTSEISLIGSWGKGTDEDSILAGVQHRNVRRDFFFYTHELSIDGTYFKPKNGHTITVVDTGEVYEVVSPEDASQSPNTMPWNYTTASHYRIRVHGLRTVVGTCGP